MTISTTVQNAVTAAANSTTTPTSTTASAAAATSATAATNAQMNYNNFLKLLTTQLKNQDPTAPTDTNQLTLQIATLIQVEQQITTNNDLQSLITLFGANSSSNMVGYIGKQVETAGNQVVLQNKMANVVYSLPTAATTANVTITDSTGKVVLNAAGTTLAGRNQVGWTGLDNNGNQLADGTYTVSVTAKDASGKAIAATTSTVGVVTSIDTSSGTSTLSIGNVSVPLNAVTRVS